MIDERASCLQLVLQQRLFISLPRVILCAL